MVEVIVQFEALPTGDILRQVRTAGRQYQAIPAVHMTVPASMIETIAADPAVAYVSPNRTATNFLDITTQSVKANWFWSTDLNGTNVGVAVIDSGVAPKIDLWSEDGATSRIVYRHASW